MITLLNPKIKEFTHIFHIADIHIRLNQRHDEYRQIFLKLYDEIRNSPEKTVVALLGDIFHNKVELSPECVQAGSDFLKNIADLRPVILVAGNHDAILSNKSRLDSLTPIVDALNHRNIFYLKTTGLYGFGNILFNNMCVFDEPSCYVRGYDIPKIYRNQYKNVVALFHGAVDMAVSETGYRISNPSVMLPLFDDHDIALLGDIHKRQNMQEYIPDENKPCVHYVGTLIQQNHGEDFGNHGYSLWDLSTNTYTFQEIKSATGYFTVEMNRGVVITDLSNLPKNVYIRFKLTGTIASEVKVALTQIKEKSNVLGISYLRMDTEIDKSDVIDMSNAIDLTDLGSVDYQNKLVNDYLQKKLNITNQETIDAVFNINRELNGIIKKDEFSRNLKWKPIRFEWDNMFAYGENNYIDFSNMEGTYGIFGLNRSGKSSLLSAFMFCLFDKFDRGSKGICVLNTQKQSFRCKLEFEIGGIHYFIERKGTLGRNGNVSVSVRFWKKVNDLTDEIEELHGTERRSTNDIIRDYVGTYEDFILTTASFQTVKNNISFIDMGNSDRKDLLVQYIGLSIFDRLSEAAGEKNKELKTLLKVHKDKNYSLEKQQNENAYNHAISLIAETNNEINIIKKQISDVNEQIINESSNLIKLDPNVPTNLEVLLKQKEASNAVLMKKKKNIHDTKELLWEKERTILDINEEIRKLETLNLSESHKKYSELSVVIADIKQKIALHKSNVKTKLEKVARLDTHEYDPNCLFCTNNSFVKDATKAKKELIKDKEIANEFMLELSKHQGEFDSYAWVTKAYESYTNLLNERSSAKDLCATYSKNIIISTNELERMDAAYNALIEKIDIYHRNKTSVEHNIKIQSIIDSYKKTLSKLDTELQKKNASLMDFTSKKEVFHSKIDTISILLKEVKSLEIEFEIYQKYLETMGRDGIPYQIISNAVPEIEREVNSILTQTVDYTIKFETDGKNITPYIVYPHGQWPIELSSGFERFVASIAIRVALTNISNLPKTTFLALDEGFGTLDSEQMASMSTLFAVLKNQYDFILIISHHDVLKDFVEKRIEIKKENNYSKLCFD